MSENKDDGLDLLSVEEAAAYLKFSTNYIYKLAKQNKIPHVNFGRHGLFSARKICMAGLVPWLRGRNYVWRKTFADCEGSC